MANTTRRQFKSRMAAKQDVWRAIPALMGDGNGTIEVPNQANMVYIRVGDGDLGQAFNNRCQLRDNLAIYVGYDPVTDPDRRIFQVLSVRMADYAGAGNVTVPNVGPHHTTHEFGGGDDVLVDWRRIMGLRVGRPALFVVTVDPGYIYRAGWIAIPSTTVDLTATHAALVGTQAQYVLISLSSVGAVTATAGAVVISPAALTIADVPIPPAGHIPLAAVRLYKVQTTIGDTLAAPDIIDLRFPTYNSAAASGVAGGANTQVQYNNGGVLAGSPLMTFVSPHLRLGNPGVTNGGFRLETFGNFAPFAFVTSYGVFGGFIDDIMGWGYNTNGASKIVAGVADLGWNMEADYFNAGVHGMEWNMSFTNPAGTYTTRPFAFFVDRDSTTNANCEMYWQWCIGSAGASKFRVSLADGNHVLLNLAPDGALSLFDDVESTAFVQETCIYDGVDTTAVRWSIAGAATNKTFRLDYVTGIGKDPITGTNILLDLGGDLQMNTHIAWLSEHGRLDVPTDTATAVIAQFGHAHSKDVTFKVGVAPDAADCALVLPRNLTETSFMRIAASITGGGIIGSNGYYIDAVADAATPVDLYFRQVRTGAGAYVKTPLIIRAGVVDINFNVGGYAFKYGSDTVEFCFYISNTSSNVMIGTSTDGMTSGGSLAISKDLAHRGTKVGFFNTAPVVVATSTTDLRQALINYGLYTAGGATPLDLNGGAITATGNNTLGQITISDAKNVILNTTTGTQFGTATNQKLAFYGGTPIVRGAALTAQLTTITHTAPVTPDYAIQDMVDVSLGAGWAFADHDEANTVLSVIANLQTRVAELEARLGSSTGVNLFA